MCQYLRFLKRQSRKDQSVWLGLSRKRPSELDKNIGSQGSICDAIHSIKTQKKANKDFKNYLEKTLFSICEYLLVRNRYVYIEGRKILEKNTYQNFDPKNKK